MAVSWCCVSDRVGARSSRVQWWHLVWGRSMGLGCGCFVNCKTIHIRECGSADSHVLRFDRFWSWMHITAICVVAVSQPVWLLFPVWKLCVLTGGTDAGAGWRQPCPSMKTRRQISNLFLFLIQLCWKGQLCAYGNLFFFSRYGGWVCSVTFLVLFYFSFSALPDCCMSDVTIWGICFNGKDSGIEGEAVDVQPVTPGSEVLENSHWKAEGCGMMEQAASMGLQLGCLMGFQGNRDSECLDSCCNPNLFPFTLIAGIAQQTIRGKHKCPQTDFSPPVLWRMPFPCHRLPVTVIFSES